MTMSETLESFDLLGEAVALAIPYARNLLGALLVLLVGWFVAGWAQRSVQRVMDLSGRIDKTLKPKSH